MTNQLQNDAQVVGSRRVGRKAAPRTFTEGLFRWVTITTVVAVFTFLVAPLLIVAIESFNSVNYLKFPIEGFSLKFYNAFFQDSRWLSAVGTSLKIAGVAALLATVIGVMGAWALSRTKTRGSGLVYALMYSPIVVPTIVLAIAFYFVLLDFKLVGNWVAVAVVYSILGIPYVLVATSSALRYFDPDLENAARSLGASPIKALLHVTFPQIISGIFGGAILAFILAFDEAIIILFVSGGGAVTLPRKLWDSLRYDLDPTLAVAGTLLIAVFVILYVGYEVVRSIRQRQRSKR